MRVQTCIALIVLGCFPHILDALPFHKGSYQYEKEDGGALTVREEEKQKREGEKAVTKMDDDEIDHQGTEVTRMKKEKETISKRKKNDDKNGKEKNDDKNGKEKNDDKKNGKEKNDDKQNGSSSPSSAGAKSSGVCNPQCADNETCIDDGSGNFSCAPGDGVVDSSSSSSAGATPPGVCRPQCADNETCENDGNGNFSCWRDKGEKGGFDVFG